MDPFERHSLITHRLINGFIAVLGGIFLCGAFLMALGRKNDVLRLRGTFEPIDAVAIHSPRQGRILEVRAQSGTWVQSGDTLFILDRNALELPLLQAEGRLREIEAEISSTRLFIKAWWWAYKRRLIEAEEAVKRARISLAELVQEKCIERGISASNSIAFPLSSAVRSLASYKLRESDLRSARSHLEALRADTLELVRRRTDLRTLAAQRMKYSREVDYYRRQWTDSVILAPRDGYIIGQELRELQGGVVDEGEILCRLGTCRKWRLRCKAEGRRVVIVRRGSQARILVKSAQGGSPWLWRGQVSFVASAPIQSARAKTRKASDQEEYIVLIALDPGLPEMHRQELITGRNGEARIQLGERPLYAYVMDHLFRK